MLDEPISSADSKTLIFADEQVVADGRYFDERVIQPPIYTPVIKHLYKRARSRQENVNSYFKNFNSAFNKLPSGL